MSKIASKHMSAQAEDDFEEELEGSDMGNPDDWETELGLKILKIESKLDKAKNAPVVAMLRRKLVTYNAAMLFLNENAKAATLVGSRGGLQSIVSYITKQAVEDAAKDETRKYSNLIMPHLPGYKLTKHLKEGGLAMSAAAEAAESFSE